MLRFFLYLLPALDLQQQVTTRLERGMRLLQDLQGLLSWEDVYLPINHHHEIKALAKVSLPNIGMLK